MIRYLMALTLLTLTPATQDGGSARLLTDFSSGGVPLQWYSVNDGVMGGRSNGSFRIDAGRLVFEGSLNTNGGGFASLRTRPARLELDDRSGIHLRVRGDGRVYTMRLQQDEPRRGSVSYRAEFRAEKGQEWQDIWLPFDAFVPTWRGRVLDLPPVDPARVTSLGLMIADKIDGPFRLEVDAIGAFAPFDLDDLRGQRRALLLFAPNADDARLRQQLTAALAERAGLRDRDMTLIVLLAEGASAVGGRSLTPAESSVLRSRFAVTDTDFAVKLVGKDGSTRHTVDNPAPMAEVFALVDSMPMRKAEVGERRIDD